MECIFKEKEFLDLKILQLSYCCSSDLWSGAAKLIYSSPCNIELNRIRKGLCFITGDAKSLSANTALQSSCQKGRRNWSNLKIIVDIWRYLEILIFPRMVLWDVGISAYSRCLKHFDTPKYGPMDFHMWKDCAIHFRTIMQMGFLVTVLVFDFDYLWC